MQVKPTRFFFFFFFSPDEMFVVGENDQTVYRGLKSAADFVPG